MGFFDGLSRAKAAPVAPRWRRVIRNAAQCLTCGAVVESAHELQASTWTSPGIQLGAAHGWNDLTEYEDELR